MPCINSVFLCYFTHLRSSKITKKKKQCTIKSEKPKCHLGTFRDISVPRQNKNLQSASIMCEFRFFFTIIPGWLSSQKKIISCVLSECGGKHKKSFYGLSSETDYY